MAYQFIHIETYSKKPKRVKGAPDQFNSIDQVLGEAARDGHFSQHVANPKEPLQARFPGMLSLSEFQQKHTELLASIRETVTTANGQTYTRKLRDDAATLYTEIHSHPLTPEELDADPESKRIMADWMSRVVIDFQKRMPKGVDFTAVLHLDESHVHIHILAMNTPDPKLDANKLHAGKVAAARWRDANESDVIAPLPKPELVTRPLKPKKRRPSKNRHTQAKHDAEHIAAVAAWEQACTPIDATNAELMVAWEARNKDHIRAARQKRGKAGVQRAYDAAMKKLQDDYYEAVGKQCGLLRFGPRQARKSTKVYNAEKEQARRSAKTYADAEQIRLAAIGKEAVLAERVERVEQQEAALQDREARLAAEKDALARRENNFVEKVKAATEALRAEKAAMAARREQEEQRLAEQAEALKAREQRLCEGFQLLQVQRAEVNEAIETMDEVLTAVETGETSMEDGRLTFQRLPAFLQRMILTDWTHRSPVQKLVGRFLNILRRAQGWVGDVGQERDGPTENDGPGR